MLIFDEQANRTHLAVELTVIVFATVYASVTVLITNTGTAAGSFEAVLKINGEVEETKEIILDVGASQEVTFTVTRDISGSYSIDVNGLSGFLTVKEKPVPPEHRK